MPVIIYDRFRQSVSFVFNNACLWCWFYADYKPPPQATPFSSKNEKNKLIRGNGWHVWDNDVQAGLKSGRKKRMSCLPKLDRWRHDTSPYGLDTGPGDPSGVLSSDNFTHLLVMSHTKCLNMESWVTSKVRFVLAVWNIRKS